MAETTPEALFAAVANSDLANVQAILADEPSAAAARDEQGLSPVQHAAYRGESAILEALVAARKSLDVFEAALTGQLAELRARLDEERGRVGTHSPDGFTALHLAVFAGHADAARLLLQRGASTTARTTNPMANQPLHAAAVCSDATRRLDCCRLLLEAGAPVDATQAGGFAPLHAAAQLGDLALAELLLAHGAEADLPADDGRIASTIARDAGHEALAKALGATGSAPSPSP